MSKFEYFKKSLKVPYKLLEVGESEIFLFFEVGGDIFYILNSD